MRTVRLFLALFATLPLGGCFLPLLLPGLFGGGGGGGGAAPPAVKTPFDNAAAPRAASQKGAQAQPTGTAVRVIAPSVPDPVTPTAPLWEFRTYAYHPYNSRGESELLTLVKTLGREGWELQGVHLNASGPSQATFRRWVRKAPPTQSGPPQTAGPASAPTRRPTAAGENPTRDARTSRPASGTPTPDTSPFIPRTGRDIEGQRP